MGLRASWFAIFGLLTFSAFGQSPSPRIQIAGTITAAGAVPNQITIHTDAGQTITVTAGERTLVLRIPPGETDPKKGTKVALSTLAVGDRVVAMGPKPADPANLSASAIMVMTKSDVAQVRARESEDWQKRGVSGLVTAIDPAARTVTLKSGAHTVTVQTSDKTSFHRYSADSAKPSDAKVSSFAEIKTGDQVRVLGNKDESGASVAAENMYFGSFRQLAATVKSIDAAAGEMTVTDLATKKPLMIRVTADANMRKLPIEMATMLARRYRHGAEQTVDASGRGGRGGSGGRSGNADLQSMLDRLPPMQFSELKNGDAIMVSTTQGSDPTRVTAINLLAGVEPLLTASPTATRDIMSGWNLGGEGSDSSQ
ncbi:MAG TPA: DUF5666 domain-containing protein [Bryobacteraceae bacterium]|jgi:hypothetical protein